MPTITPVCAADLEGLAVLYEELTGNKTNLLNMARIFDQIAGNNNYLLIGARDRKQRLVGSLMGILCMDIVGECRPFLVLENVIVSESYRRQGIGRKLIAYIENWARKHDCYYIMLVSLSRRKQAHDFYARLDYKPGVVQGYKKYL